MQKYFAYTVDGVDFFDTEAEAIQAAKDAIEQCRNDAYDEWWDNDDVRGIRWGIVKQSAVENRRYKPNTTGMSEAEKKEIEYEFGVCDYLVDYQLADVESDLPLPAYTIKQRQE